MNTHKSQQGHPPIQPLAIIILAAGHGTRMQSAIPKVLHKIAGLSMLGHVIKTATTLAPERMAVVIGDHSPQVGEAARQLHPDIEVFVQAPPLGTGDSVKQALPALEGFTGTVLVLFGDVPLVSSQTLLRLAKEARAGSAVSVLGFHPSLEHAYGRLILDDQGVLTKIVEHKDASPAERAIDLCNSGIMAIDAGFLRDAVPAITNNNAKGEYYLTDLVAMAIAKGLPCSAIDGTEAEVMGVDARTDLAAAERIWQDRKRQTVMREGVTLNDPSTVYFSHDTSLGRDVTVGQNVVFGPGVSIGDNVVVNPFSHVEGASLQAGAVVGPYARLRPGTQLGEDVRVGNFVEIKNAVIARGAKISHLSYIGDAELGADVNIGAGTITCNYDGFNKFRTVIKDGAFIGSNSSLVAPVTIGAGAYVGSGSVITKDIAADALGVARGRQTMIAGWAKRYRTKRNK